jgi:hypothetical protein
MAKFVTAEKSNKHISVLYLTTLPVAKNIKHLMVVRFGGLVSVIAGSNPV